MITITRVFLHQLRTVLRRALRLSIRDPGPDLLFTTGADGLRIRSASFQAAIEYHTPGDFAEDRICVPFALLTDAAGTKSEPVRLEQESDGRVAAGWSDKMIPQVVKYDPITAELPSMPAVPTVMAVNDASLWRALADAMQIAVTDSTRYGLSCVQLRGEGGRVVATDGRQLLVQRGFSFSWGGDLLIPRTTLFACKDLPADGPLRIGRNEQWLTLQTGPWDFHLAIESEARFPKTEDFVQRPERASTRLTLAPEDAAFLADAIGRLPCNADDENQSVTVDLNGKVLVRAKSGDSKVPTELVLSRSTTNGEDLRFVTNRNYLAHALKLGFRELWLYGKEAPAQAVSENRDYVWALLSEGTALKAAHNAVRIDSCDGGRLSTTPPPTPPPAEKTASPLPTPKAITNRRSFEMAKTNRFQTPNAADENGSNGSNGNGSNGQAAVVSDTADLIEQAETLRSTLRTAAGQASDLIAALKQQKKTARSVQSALATLRQLDRVAL